MIDDLGEFLKQQRHTAQMSLRQLATAAGVSNPYLSQIERGLRRPSAEVLQQIARGLQISATALYARAGLLDEPFDNEQPSTADADSTAVTSAVVSAISTDPHLDPAQRRALIDVYTAFVADERPPRE